MLRLWPPPVPIRPRSDEELAEMYAYPERLDRPYLRMNFGQRGRAASADGCPRALSSAPDRRVFGLLRRLAG